MNDIFFILSRQFLYRVDATSDSKYMYFRVFIAPKNIYIYIPAK